MPQASEPSEGIVRPGNGHQGIALGKVTDRFANRDRFQPAFGSELQRSVDQPPPKIPMR